jgi:hypothetical protein
MFDNGTMRGPANFSTIGMRIQNEQSGSSSLFAQPTVVEPVPEKQEAGTREQGSEVNADVSAEAGHPEHPKLARGVLETRMETALAELAADHAAPSSTVRQGHMALLKRWYYRPEAKRTGEIFFPDAAGQWPVKALLRGVGRVAAKTMISSST